MFISNKIKLTPVDGEIINFEGNYNINGLPPEDASIIHSCTNAIHNYIGSTKRSIINIGRSLNTAKPILGHGQFGEWLKLEFEWSERTAQRYMQAAAFADEHEDVAKCLPEKALYLISAKGTPPSVKEKVIVAVASGIVPKASEIEADVAAAKIVAPKAGKAKDAALSKADRKALAEKAAKFLAERMGDDLPAFMVDLKQCEDLFIPALKKVSHA